MGDSDDWLDDLLNQQAKAEAASVINEPPHDVQHVQTELFQSQAGDSDSCFVPPEVLASSLKTNRAKKKKRLVRISEIDGTILPPSTVSPVSSIRLVIRSRFSRTSAASRSSSTSPTESPESSPRADGTSSSVSFISESSASLSPVASHSSSSISHSSQTSSSRPHMPLQPKSQSSLVAPRPFSGFLQFPSALQSSSTPSQTHSSSTSIAPVSSIFTPFSSIITNIFHKDSVAEEAQAMDPSFTFSGAEGNTETREEVTSMTSKMKGMWDSMLNLKPSSSPYPSISPTNDLSSHSSSSTDSASTDSASTDSASTDSASTDSASTDSASTDSASTALLLPSFSNHPSSSSSMSSVDAQSLIAPFPNSPSGVSESFEQTPLDSDTLLISAPVSSSFSAGSSLISSTDPDSAAPAEPAVTVASEPVVDGTIDAAPAGHAVTAVEQAVTADPGAATLSEPAATHTELVATADAELIVDAVALESSVDAVAIDADKPVVDIVVAEKTFTTEPVVANSSLSDATDVIFPVVTSSTVLPNCNEHTWLIPADSLTSASVSLPHISSSPKSHSKTLEDSEPKNFLVELPASVLAPDCLSGPATLAAMILAPTSTSLPAEPRKLSEQPVLYSPEQIVVQSRLEHPNGLEEILRSQIPSSVDLDASVTLTLEEMSESKDGTASPLSASISLPSNISPSVLQKSPVSETVTTTTPPISIVLPSLSSSSPSPQSSSPSLTELTSTTRSYSAVGIQFLDTSQKPGSPIFPAQDVARRHSLSRNLSLSKEEEENLALQQALREIKARENETLKRQLAQLKEEERIRSEMLRSEELRIEALRQEVLRLEAARRNSAATPPSRHRRSHLRRTSSEEESAHIHIRRSSDSLLLRENLSFVEDVPQSRPTNSSRRNSQSTSNERPVDNLSSETTFRHDQCQRDSNQGSSSARNSCVAGTSSDQRRNSKSYGAHERRSSVESSNQRRNSTELGDGTQSGSLHNRRRSESDMTVERKNSVDKFSRMQSTTSGQETRNSGVGEQRKSSEPKSVRRKSSGREAEGKMVHETALTNGENVFDSSSPRESVETPRSLPPVTRERAATLQRIQSMEQALEASVISDYFMDQSIEGPLATQEEEGGISHDTTRVKLVLDLHKIAPNVSELSRNQNAKCAACRKTLQISYFSSPPYCHYTGKLYCSKCHLGEKRAVPARLVHLGDPKDYPVCCLAREYLDAVYAIPSLPMPEVHSMLHSKHSSIRMLRARLLQLAHMQAYIETCRNKDNLLLLLDERPNLLLNLLPKDTHLKPNDSRKDMLDNLDDVHSMYSVQDLVETFNGKLLTRLQEVVEFIGLHIMDGSCEICLSKGSYCGMTCCPDPNVLIYPFQLQDVVQCEHCAAIFHQACFKPQDCPKCLRLRKRSHR